MKKYYSLLLVTLLIGSVATAFAAKPVPDQNLTASAQEYAAQSADVPAPQPELTASDVKAAVEKGLKSLTDKKNGILTKTKADIAEIKKDQADLNQKISGKGGIFDSIDALTGKDGALTTIGADVKSTESSVKRTEEKLFGKIGKDGKVTEPGELAKNRTAVEKIDATMLWMTGANIVVVGGMIIIFGLASIIFLKRAIRGVEKKVQGNTVMVQEVFTSVVAIPQKTADIVLAFDAKPLEVTVKGHKATFQQDAAALDRMAYQVLLVKDDVVGITPETYELEEVSDRKKALDSFRRTMREYLNGTLEELAGNGDSKAALTVALIEKFKDTKRLEIIKL